MSDTTTPAGPTAGIGPRRIAPTATGGQTPTAGTGVGLQLLRAVIENSARSEFRTLSEELFNADELPYYRIVSDYYRRHGVLPTMDVMVEHGMGLRSPAPAPVAYYRERLLQRATFNVFMSEQPHIVQALSRRDMATAIEHVATLQRNANRFQNVQDIFTLGESIEGVLEDFERASLNPGIQGATLGWDYLDEITGGAEAGDVVTFAARPGMGKSYLLINAARRAWMLGSSVLFVTNEMEHRQISRRFLGLHAGVNPDFIRRGQLSTFARNVVYDTARNIATGAPFHLISGSFKKTVPAVDAAIQEFSPDVVYIDASYLMKSQGGHSKKSKHELLSDVGEEIKTMAMQRRKPVIQTVQLSRETKKDKGGPDLTHIAGTDAIGQISTVVVFIGPGPVNFETTQRTLDIGKNREGSSSGKMLCNFLFSPPNFDYIPTDEEGRAIIDDPTQDEWAVV